MGLKVLQNSEKVKNPEVFGYKILLQPFYLLSVTLLSLLLPLSFLLLARLSSASYFLSLASITPPKTFLFSFFLHTNPTLLHGLLLIISLAALVHGLTGRISLLTEFPAPVFRPRIHAAWILLCTLQVWVGLGIEATIKAGVDGAGFGDGRSVISKLVFLIGLHETMIHWSRTIVRPVVDDTVYGGPRKERWLEKLALAGCFGVLSWWRLRDEIDSLVVVVEVKRDLMMNIGLGDFLGLWLYYLTVAIGVCKILKGIMWFCMKFFCRGVEDDQDSDLEHEHEHELEHELELELGDKV